MDTKSKNTKKALRALFIVLFIICVSAMGVVNGYIQAYDYWHEGALSIMFSDRLEDTDLYANKMAEIERAVRDGDYISVLRAQRYADKCDFYLRMSDGKDIVVNGVIHNYDGYTLRVDYYGNISGMRYIGEGRANLGHYYPDTITIAMSKRDSDFLNIRYQEIRHNMWTIFITDICLVVASIVLLVLITKTRTEDCESDNKIKRCFYEIPLALFAAGVCLFIKMMFDSNAVVAFADTSVAAKVLCMACYGIVTLATGALFLFFILCAEERAAKKEFLRGSLIFRVLAFVWRALKWLGRVLLRFLRFLGEFFTGRLFKGTASSSFIWLDLVFIVFSIFFAVMFVLCNEVELICILLIAGWVVVLGLFVFGRYLILRDGAKLERSIKSVYSGDYNLTEQIAENSPYYKSHEMLRTLSSQYKQSVEEGVKAERMKIDLVTNVSHDLKTPLTSIISYVELLSKEDLPPAAEDYVKVLKQKSERLKNIVSDVFELAKTTSGEIEIVREELDLAKLSWQALGELEDKIEKSGFELKTKICDPPVTIISDGKRVYRIIQNLLDNALKYSMKGTRIYFELNKRDTSAVIAIKNIASYEMDFTAEEIMERFTRGDKSRTTEGSGLGLSIAQGFALACGGKLDVDIDGDMFKAIVTFPLSGEKQPVMAASAGEESGNE